MKLLDCIQHHWISSPVTLIKATGGGASGSGILPIIRKTSTAVILHIFLVSSYSGCKMQQVGVFISKHAVRGIKY